MSLIVSGKTSQHGIITSVTWEGGVSLFNIERRIAENIPFGFAEDMHE